MEHTKLHGYWNHNRAIFRRVDNLSEYYTLLGQFNMLMIDHNFQAVTVYNYV